MENNFDKHIREVMNKPPEYPFDEGLWEKMETRLLEGKKDQRKKGVFGVWLPWFVAVLGVSFAGITYLNNIEALEQITQMQQEMQQRTVEQTGVDTVYTKQSVVFYDTIFNTVVINQSSRGNDTNSKNTAYASRSTGGAANSMQYAFATARQPLFSSLRQPLFDDRNRFAYSRYFSAAAMTGEKTGLLNEDKTASIGFSTEEEEGRAGLNTNVSQLPSLPFQALVYNNEVNFFPIEMNETEQEKQRYPAAFYVQQLKPRSFALTAFLGKSHSLNLDDEWGETERGVRAELGYGKHFSLLLGFEKINSNFNIINEHDDTDFDDYATLPPRNPGDILHEIYGDFEYWQLPFGVKYAPLSRGWIHPYVGVGLVSKKAIISRLRYEYISFMKEYYVGQGNLLPGRFEVTDFWTMLGLQIDVNEHWAVIAEMGSQFRIKAGDYRYENTQLLRWNAGIRYRF